MTDRGEYRAIRRVLLDGPDFQKLSERARWVFVALKLNIGPTGIEVHYPAALSHQLAAQTGTAVDAVLEAMDALERTGWIRREGNVIWIVGQLQHDPHMDHRDNKHRVSIWRHLQGLPRVALVGEFVRHHADWFEAGEYVNKKGDKVQIEKAPDSLSRLLVVPIEGPSKAHRRPIEAPITEDREPKTNLKEGALSEESGAEAPRVEAPEPEPADATERYREVQSTLPRAIRAHAWLGDDPPPLPKGWHMGREIDVGKHLLKQFTPEELIGGIECFREAHGVAEGAQWSLSWAMSKDDRWRMLTAVRVWREKQMDQIEFPTFTPMLHVA